MAKISKRDINLVRKPHGFGFVLLIINLLDTLHIINYLTSSYKCLLENMLKETNFKNKNKIVRVHWITLLIDLVDLILTFFYLYLIK